jgi:hypothetical protein
LSTNSSPESLEKSRETKSPKGTFEMNCQKREKKVEILREGRNMEKEGS